MQANKPVPGFRLFLVLLDFQPTGAEGSSGFLDFKTIFSKVTGKGFEIISQFQIFC